MNQIVRSSLILAGLLIVVIAGSYFYSRTMKQPVAPEVAPEVAPSVEVGPDAATQTITHTPLNDEITAAIQDLQNSRPEEARARLEQIPDTDPGYLVALRHLGSACVRLGDLECARTAFHDLNQLQLDTPEVLIVLGTIEYRLGDYQAAELSALRALELDPSHADTKYSLALYRLAADRLPEAIDTYQRALEQDSSTAVVSTALERLLELHERRQDLAGVHYALAFFARTMSRPEQEVQELEHYLETNPDASTARIARARLDEARAILPD